MRKIILIVFMVFAFQSPVFADDPIIKLGRGLGSILTSPMEFPVQYSRLDNEGHGPLTTTVSGTIFGLGGMVTRIVVGAVEIVTFLIPIPADYQPIMANSAVEEYRIQKRMLQ